MPESTPGAPAGHPTLTPYLTVKGADAAVEYYCKTFGGEEVYRMTCPQTHKVLHAEVRIGNSLLYLSEEFPQMGVMAPQEGVPSPVTVHCYCADVDATFNTAVASGSTGLMPPADMFWGDRFAKIKDPFGHSWSLATHKEDLTPEETHKRMLEAMAAMSGQSC